MKMKFTFLAMLLLLTACGNQPSAKNSDVITLSQASSSTAAIYKARCIRCHATDLSGKMEEATNIQKVYDRLTYDEIVEKISSGGKLMPSFKGSLSDEEIEGLAKWLSKQ